MNGWCGKILRVDLSLNQSHSESLEPALLQQFLGGRGLGAYFLFTEISPHIDPLSADNFLAFCTGPLTGTHVPTGGRSSLSMLSPLTHTVFDCNSGSQFGVRLKWAGFDALILEGAASEPVWLEVSAAGCTIHPASDLWGLEIPDVTSRLQCKDAAIVCIGPAGEHRVLVASIMDDEGHAYGRGGAGAVMGSKNVKAICARGGGPVPIANAETLKFVDYETRKWLNASPRTSQGLPEFGTSVLVNLTNWYGVLPTRNFQEGEFEGASAISGEELRDTHLVKRGACWGCPVACKRKTRTLEQEGEGPEYETIYALGSNLGIDDFAAVIEANYLCNRLGLDTISVGATISCAMELAERGLLQGDLRFGRADLLRQAVEDTAYRRGFGDDLADGSRHLADKYGGPEVAMQVKGLELPGYDPRGMQGQGLLYATSNRGACHLRGNMLGPELLGVPKMVDRHSYRGKAGLEIVLQHSGAVIDSIGMCKFAAFAIGDEFFARLLSAVTGVPYKVQDMLMAGERIWNLERLYNLRAGFTRVDDTLPPRFLNTPLEKGGTRGQVVHLDEMLEEYYRFRGWTQQGVPTAAKLQALGLDRLAAQYPQEETHA